ncbi:MAG TPA: molybdopterin-binding protein [Syntrophomonadaceae bacterium]|nr:molybdopterin-binding protein [Syntrophomonadaceae bacterium]HNX28389.1 molybdopterin-binding protein [Syntrophomonadaceae bacterium]HPR92679.1 molybdopterin-binding protein [Syntrophomonadaceae bacterium]
MQLSARNALKGKIVKVVEGTVNSEIHIQLSGGETIVSVITKESAEKMGLAAGKEAYAVIKASSVMVAID